MTPQMPNSKPGYVQVTFAKDQPEYLPLPAITDGETVETCWRLTFYERLACLFLGKLHLRLLTFGRPLQPIGLSVLPDK